VNVTGDGERASAAILAVIAKDFRTSTMIFLRQENILRDHGGGAG
jgi:hypothetical protein